MEEYDRKVPARVEDYFYRGGLNCAESTLRVLIEREIIDAPLRCTAMMSGFGGGLQRGLVCGAVTGAVAALGWVFGRVEPGAPREPSARAVKEFLARFEDVFHAVECDTLRQINSPGQELKSDGMYSHCALVVRTAAHIAASIIQENTDWKTAR
ncbi:MAG TPA: C-GCAxxG-C-C family protein [Bacillota bacterium]|nr:C-GCAxxG-C-C family protein [Bacillota bacterium]